jgi:hypothetical protein
VILTVFTEIMSFDEKHNQCVELLVSVDYP